MAAGNCSLSSHQRWGFVCFLGHCSSSHNLTLVAGGGVESNGFGHCPVAGIGRHKAIPGLGSDMFPDEELPREFRCEWATWAG